MSFEDIAKILLNNTKLEYFDLKSLKATNKFLNTTVCKETYNIDQSISHRIYASIYGYFVNKFPCKLKDKSKIMGVRIMFIGNKKHQYFRNSIDTMIDTSIIDPYLQDLMVIGIAHKNNEKPFFYFGNNDKYTCVELEKIQDHREGLLNTIKHTINDVKQFDITFCNIEDNNFYEFISQFIQIINKHMSVHTINLFKEETIPENILIYH